MIYTALAVNDAKIWRAHSTFPAFANTHIADLILYFDLTLKVI